MPQGYRERDFLQLDASCLSVSDILAAGTLLRSYRVPVLRQNPDGSYIMANEATRHRAEGAMGLVRTGRGLDLESAEGYSGDFSACDRS